MRTREEWTPGRVLGAMRDLAPGLGADLPPGLASAARRYFGGPGRAALCAGVPAERVPRAWLRTRGAVALAAAQLHLRQVAGREGLEALGLGVLRLRARRLGFRWSEAVAEGLRLREEYPVRPLLELEQPPAETPPVATPALPRLTPELPVALPWLRAPAEPWRVDPPRVAVPAAARSRPVRWAGQLDREQAATLATPENLPLLVAELDHPDPRERQCAMILAAATGDEGAAGPLEARLRHETDEATLTTLLEALGWAGPRGRDALAAAARREGMAGALALNALYAGAADPARRPGVLARLAALAADPTLPGHHRALAGQALAEWGWISEEESAAAGLAADPVGRGVLEAWRRIHGAPLVSRRLGWERIAARPVLGFFHPRSVQQSWVRANARLEALEVEDRARIARVDAELLERERVLAARARVGRNDPCPCGSKAKFKKCCGSGERSPLDGWVPLRGRPGIPLTAMLVPPYGQPESPHLLQAVQDPRPANLRAPAGASPFHRWFLACRAGSVHQEDLLLELALEVLEGWGADERLDYVRILHCGFGPLQRIPQERLEPVVERVAEAGCASAIYLLAKLLALREDRWQLLPRLGERILDCRAQDGDALAAWLLPAVGARGIPAAWLLSLGDRLVQPTTRGATLEDLRLLVDEAAGMLVWVGQPVAPPPTVLSAEQAPWLFHPWEGAAALNDESRRARTALWWFRQPLSETLPEDSAEAREREATARRARVEALQHRYADIRRQAGEHEVEVVGRLAEAGFFGDERETLNVLLPRSGSRLRSLALAAAAGRVAGELGLSLRSLDFRGGRPALRLQGEQAVDDTVEQGLMVTAQEVAGELGLEPAPLYNLLLGELDAYPAGPGAAFTVPEGRLAAEAARREMHPWRLAFELGRQGESLPWWLGDLDPAAPLEAGVPAVAARPSRPPRPEDDPDELRRSLRRACRRTLRQGKIGESHTAFDHLMKGVPKHLRGEAREFFEALVTAGLLRDKPTHYGRQISIEPRAVPLVERFVEDGTVPEAVRRAFAVREVEGPS